MTIGATSIEAGDAIGANFPLAKSVASLLYYVYYVFVDVGANTYASISMYFELVSSSLY